MPWKRPLPAVPVLDADPSLLCVSSRPPPDPRYPPIPATPATRLYPVAGARAGRRPLPAVRLLLERQRPGAVRGRPRGALQIRLLPGARLDAQQSERAMAWMGILNTYRHRHTSRDKRPRLMWCRCSDVGPGLVRMALAYLRGRVLGYPGFAASVGGARPLFVPARIISHLNLPFFLPLSALRGDCGRSSAPLLALLPHPAKLLLPASRRLLSAAVGGSGPHLAQWLLGRLDASEARASSPH